MHTAEAGCPIKQGPRLQDLTAPPERLDCIGGPWGAVDGAWRESARSDCHVREQRMGEGLSLGEEGGTLRQATGAERHLGGAVGFFVLTECLRGEREAPDCLVPGQGGRVGTACCPCLRQVPEMARGESEAWCLAHSRCSVTACRDVCACASGGGQRVPMGGTVLSGGTFCPHCIHQV